MEFVRATWENDHEYMSIVGDLLKNEELLKLDDITHHHYTTRLVHSIFVSYVSYKITKARGLDYVSTARAGLLHDFFLEERDEILALGMGSHNSAHPKIALKNAQKITEINDLEKDIILKHMFLCTLNPYQAFSARQKGVVCTKFHIVNEFKFVSLVLNNFPVPSTSLKNTSKCPVSKISMC